LARDIGRQRIGDLGLGSFALMIVVDTSLVLRRDEVQDVDR
jgi:hypothetical protein